MLTISSPIVNPYLVSSGFIFSPWNDNWSGIGSGLWKTNQIFGSLGICIHSPNSFHLSSSRMLYMDGKTRNTYNQ